MYLLLTMVFYKFIHSSIHFVNFSHSICWGIRGEPSIFLRMTFVIGSSQHKIRSLVCIAHLNNNNLFWKKYRSSTCKYNIFTDRVSSYWHCMGEALSGDINMHQWDFLLSVNNSNTEIYFSKLCTNMGTSIIKKIQQTPTTKFCIYTVITLTI